MSVKHTKRNYVMIGKPRPQDRFFILYISVPTGQVDLGVLPIEQYQSSIDWAISMADYMAGPIGLLPIESDDAQMRALVIANACMGIHVSKDPEVQRMAKQLLVDMGEVKLC